VADWIKRIGIALPQSRLSLDLNQMVPSARHLMPKKGADPKARALVLESTCPLGQLVRVCYGVMMLNTWLLRISLAWLALLVVAATYVLMMH